MISAPTSNLHDIRIRLGVGEVGGGGLPGVAVVLHAGITMVSYVGR